MVERRLEGEWSVGGGGATVVGCVACGSWVGVLNGRQDFNL